MLDGGSTFAVLLGWFGRRFWLVALPIFWRLPIACDDLGFIPFVGAGVLARELATDGSTGMDGTPAMLDAATGFLKFAGSMVFWMTGLTLGSVSAVQLQRPLFFPVDYAIT